MQVLELTNKEIKALKELLYNHNSCVSGCVYPNMQNSNKNCDQCEFKKSLECIEEKINE